VLPFDEIPARVAAGACDAGLLIHEGQLTYAREGLSSLLDLGLWWAERTGGLPLPLGGNAIRRDLGPARLRELAGILEASIRYGLEHRSEALRHALRFGRGLDEGLADRFVGMYVNALTLDYGERGRQAVRRFLAEGRAAGVIEKDVTVEFITSGGLAS
jgi:1,4-dihydroxy-6-naphthoate synthase